MLRHKTHCTECCAIFNDWDTVYSWYENGEYGYLCEDCFDAKFDALSRIEKAELIGSEAVFAKSKKPFRIF